MLMIFQSNLVSFTIPWFPGSGLWSQTLSYSYVSLDFTHGVTVCAGFCGSPSVVTITSQLHTIHYRSGSDCDITMASSLY
ncbi:hypothetical protein EXN66_Car005084 [Channa argus]|uniref:Uncharacterized protein n=1 Tax=Channa argus TaxID=215402 RepID=A0A6G1PGQ0_CHAAH|nr:hypothetical protein EXN66_Car005084 [Channa argus]